MKYNSLYSEPVKQETGVRQGCIVGPYLLSIFTAGIIAYISKKTHM